MCGHWQKQQKQRVLSDLRPPAHKYLRSRILCDHLRYEHKCPEVRGDRKPSPGPAVMKCIVESHPLPVPSRPCVQLWSRITLQWTHQRVRLIWGVLPERTGLLSKNTASQIGTTLISHTHTHTFGPWAKGHRGACYSFLNDLKQKSEMHLTRLWGW